LWSIGKWKSANKNTPFLKHADFIIVRQETSQFNSIAILTSTWRHCFLLWNLRFAVKLLPMPSAQRNYRA
jgi:hypothetical protein